MWPGEVGGPQGHAAGAPVRGGLCEGCCLPRGTRLVLMRHLSPEASGWSQKCGGRGPWEEGVNCQAWGPRVRAEADPWPWAVWASGDQLGVLEMSHPSWDCSLPSGKTGRQACRALPGRGAARGT